MLINNCRLVILKDIPLLTQLQLEEALLRNDDQNWCLINTDNLPAIVLGISGIPEDFLFIDNVKQDAVPVIKRFSGGGTVFVDPSTIFVTWLIKHPETISLFSQKILEHIEKIYRKIFPEDFLLKDNDFCIADKKIGGNALYIQKNRWMLHSSFLWDFNNDLMTRYLKEPKQQPVYRKQRQHGNFLDKLKRFYNDKEEFLVSFKNHFINDLNMTEVHVDTIIDIIHLNHRKTTQLLSL